MVLPVIMALSQLAPSIIGLLTRDKTATQAAQVVSQVAQAVTGEPSDDAALLALQDNPEKLAEFKAQMDAHALSMYEAETARAEIVNNTMHLEAANSSLYVKYMRPTFGYAVVFMMLTMFLNITGALLRDTAKAVDMIEAYAQMEWVFVAMLSAMGVYISKRSKDKNPGALGVIGSLIGRFKK